MCGLVGVVGNQITNEALTALAFLGTLSSLRGDHSTGYMDYMQGLQVPIQYNKTLESPESYFKPDGSYFNKYYRKRYKNHNPVAIAVHTRLATLGKVTKDNCHPFQHGNILGMHNGTIRSKQLPYCDKFETDSEALYYGLSKDGIENLKTIEGIFDSAYALVWINSKNSTINFLRNKERSMFFFQTYDQGVAFWASDENWLKSVVPYFGFKGNIRELPVNLMHSVPLKSKSMIKDTVTERIVKEYARTVYSGNSTPKVVAVPTKSSEVGTQYQRHNPSTYWVSEAHKWMTWDEEKLWNKLKYEESEKERNSQKEDKSNNVTPFRAENTKDFSTEAELTTAINFFKDEAVHKMVQGKDGFWYFRTLGDSWTSEAFYRRILSCGCRTCNSHIRLYDNVVFVSSRDFVCETCAEDKEAMEMATNEVFIELEKNEPSKGMLLVPDSSKDEWEYVSDKLVHVERKVMN